MALGRMCSSALILAGGLIVNTEHLCILSVYCGGLLQFMPTINAALLLEPIQDGMDAFQLISLIGSVFFVSGGFILEDALKCFFGGLWLKDVGDIEVLFFGLEATLYFSPPGLIKLAYLMKTLFVVTYLLGKVALSYKAVFVLIVLLERAIVLGVTVAVLRVIAFMLFMMKTAL